MIWQATNLRVWTIYILWWLKSMCYYLDSSKMPTEEGRVADYQRCAMNFEPDGNTSYFFHCKRRKNQIGRDEIFGIVTVSFFRKMKWIEKTGKGHWNHLRLKWRWLNCKIAIGGEHLIKMNTTQANIESCVAN